jgi:hypothetical protein
MNAVYPLAKTDIDEISELEPIREMWGAESPGEMAAILRDAVYAAKFHFVSGAPGYVGDLYILHGDALGEPVTLVRDAERKLVLA